MKTMTCADFVETYLNEKVDAIIQECCWEKSSNYAWYCLKQLELDAADRGVALTDKDDFDYETYFYDIYKVTEKGLS